jgi:hypothetical protein
MAYESVAGSFGNTDRKVLAILETGSFTTDEIEAMTGGRHQTISAAVSRLWHARGVIQPSGKRRATRSGRLADIYERIR